MGASDIVLYSSTNGRQLRKSPGLAAHTTLTHTRPFEPGRVLGVKRKYGHKRKRGREVGGKGGREVEGKEVRL